ncbi:MAG: putative iron-regulated membrane protein [Bermanella sp.]|jgi:uncharacterized iron-regulated membrane protein
MNRFLFKLHGYLALIACIPLVLVCLSGSALVFKHDIDRLLMPGKVSVQPLNSRLSLDELLKVVNGQFPIYEVVGWEIFPDPARADLISLIAHSNSERSRVTMDPYRGVVLTSPSEGGRNFTDKLHSFHYTLLLGNAGLLGSGLVAVVLCILGISGLILRRKFWRNFFTLRYSARRILFFSDLHKFLGVLASPVLLVVGFTGAYWNFPLFVYEVQKPATSDSRPMMAARWYDDSISVQSMHDDSMRRIDGFQPSYLSFPSRAGSGFSVLGGNKNANPLFSRYASSVSFSADTGDYVVRYDIRQADSRSRIENSFRRLHIGNFSGLISRVLWFVLGLVPLILAGTGISLWVKRRPQRRRALAERCAK